MKTSEEAKNCRYIMKNEEIEIIDGHDPSSYFWICPAKIISYEDTNNLDNVKIMEELEISIEEDDIRDYLYSFFKKRFNPKLKANKFRVDESEDEENLYLDKFEWYLTYNFYSFDNIEKMMLDIKEEIEKLDNQILINFYFKFIEKLENMIKKGKEF